MTDPSREIRVSDSDRQAAADRLRAALNEGRLPVAEYDDRLGRLYKAVTYGELANLFVDLPSGNPAPMMQQPMMQQPMMQQPMMAGAPMTGPIGGPAAVVQNTVVVGGPMMMPSSGMATAALVLGILGLCGFWIPFGDVVFAGLAVLFGILGLAQTNKGEYSGHGKAMAGLIMGIIGLIPAIIVISLLLSAAAVFI